MRTTQVKFVTLFVQSWLSLNKLIVNPAYIFFSFLLSLLLLLLLPSQTASPVVAKFIQGFQVWIQAMSPVVFSSMQMKQLETLMTRAVALRSSGSREILMQPNAMWGAPCVNPSRHQTSDITGLFYFLLY